MASVDSKKAVMTMGILIVTYILSSGSMPAFDEHTLNVLDQDGGGREREEGQVCSCTCTCIQSTS